MEQVIHLPVVEVRDGKKFNVRYVYLTPDILKSIYAPGDPEYALLRLNRTRGDHESLDRMTSQYHADPPPPGTILNAMWYYDVIEHGVHT